MFYMIPDDRWALNLCYDIHRAILNAITVYVCEVKVWLRLVIQFHSMSILFCYLMHDKNYHYLYRRRCLLLECHNSKARGLRIYDIWVYHTVSLSMEITISCNKNIYKEHANEITQLKIKSKSKLQNILKHCKTILNLTLTGYESKMNTAVLKHSLSSRERFSRIHRPK